MRSSDTIGIHRPAWGHETRFDSIGRFFRRHWLLSTIFFVVLIVAFIALQYGNEILRGRIEARMNAQLKGYSVRLPGLEFHPVGLSITLHGLEVHQQKHPNPAIAIIPILDASVAWKDVLHARLVADFELDRPVLHINLTQFQSEAKEPTKLKDKGWQKAAEEIYPLKINQVFVYDGTVTYIDKDPTKPLEVQHLDIDARNIRNVWSPDNVYPSTVHVGATVFGGGRVNVDGRANFMAEPTAAFDVDINAKDVPLATLKPVAAHVSLNLSKGVMNANGHAEIAPHKEDIHLKSVSVDGIELEYLHEPQTEIDEAQRIEAVKQTAKDVSNEPTTLVRVDQLDVKRSLIAYVDQTMSPGYRLFFADTNITVRNVSSQASKEPANVKVTGRFMGTGPTLITSDFMPVNKTPEFNISIQIEPTQLPPMNDLFRSYGNFDISSGQFSFYSELHAHNGQLNGYIKPLFSDMKVYDKQQDQNKSTLHNIYERAVGEAAKLLANRRDEVASKASVSGRIDNPNVKTWQVVFNLLRNAFISAITPGLEDARQANQPSKTD